MLIEGRAVARLLFPYLDAGKARVTQQWLSFTPSWEQRPRVLTITRKRSYTLGALEALTVAALRGNSMGADVELILSYLVRRASGDWGTVNEGDTEADPSATTLLLPNEYSLFGHYDWEFLGNFCSKKDAKPGK